MESSRFMGIVVAALLVGSVFGFAGSDGLRGMFGLEPLQGRERSVLLVRKVRRVSLGLKGRRGLEGQLVLRVRRENRGHLVGQI